MASDPPIEDSLPIAQGNVRADVVPSAAVTSEAAAASADGAAGGVAEAPISPPATLVVHVAGSVLRPGLVTDRRGGESTMPWLQPGERSALPTSTG